MNLTERQTLELLLAIATSRYKTTGDEWYKRLECSVERKLKSLGGKCQKK